jgi:hypothetical protein
MPLLTALKLLPLLTKFQTHVALALLALLALDLHLDLGLGETSHIIIAALAGALGVKRPSEKAQEIAGVLGDGDE